MQNINNLDEIVGKKCSYNMEQSDVWDDTNTIECTVVGFDIEIEDKFPYRLNIGIQLLPINTKDIDEDDLYDMQMGVSLDSVIFNKWN